MSKETIKVLVKRWVIISLLIFVIYTFALLTGYYGLSVEPAILLQDYFELFIKEPLTIWGLPLIAGAVFTLIFLRKSGLTENKKPDNENQSTDKGGIS
jgi:hypothetical protein